MAYFAGLDVSVKETSVCIVDDAGKIVREARVASEPEALLQVLLTHLFSSGRRRAAASSRGVAPAPAPAGQSMSFDHS
jgi:predicted NBD/HSP70 family sugar kinase